MSRWFSALVGIATGVLVGAFGQGLTGEPFLAVALGVVYAATTGVTVEYRELLVYSEEVRTERSEGEGAWAALITIAVGVAAVVGIGPWLEMEPTLELGLRLLVVGVGFGGFAMGAAFALRDVEDDDQVFPDEAT